MVHNSAFPGNCCRAGLEKIESLIKLLVSQGRRDGGDSIWRGLSKRNRNHEDQGQMDGGLSNGKHFCHCRHRDLQAIHSDLWSRTGNMVIDGRMSESKCEPQSETSVGILIRKQ